MIYATVAKGYKAGGFTARPADETSGRIPYNPEKLWDYEAGAKTDLFDGRMRLNGDAFYYQYSDLQQIANQVPPGGVSPVQYTENIGAARLWGIEGDITVAVTDRLTLFGNFGYLNAKYTKAAIVLTGVGLNTPLPKAPKWTTTAAVQYDQPLSYGDMGFRIDYSYTSQFFNDARATSTIATKAHSLVNSRISWMSPNDSWTVAVYARNLFDTKYVENGFDLTGPVGYTLAIPSQPREVGLEVTKKF
jgi:iron complex outermembrane receptor protein